MTRAATKAKAKAKKPKPTATFAERCKQLKQLGVKFTVDYEYRGEGAKRGPHNVEVFASILLPLTAHEIVALTTNEGTYYIGGCCGSSSVIQDKVDAIYRFHSGWMQIDELAAIAEACITHDGDSSRFREPLLTVDEEIAKTVLLMKHIKDRRKEGRSQMDPWYLMALVWHITKDFYGPERPRQAVSVVNKKRSVVDDAVSTLAQNLWSIAFDTMLRGDHAVDKAQIGANRLVTIARLLPALKTLNEGLDQLSPPPLEGVALVLATDPTHVLSNGMGLCVYARRADAQRLIDSWTREDEQYVGEGKGRRQAVTDFAIRPVRVTRDKGIEFIPAFAKEKA